MVALRSSTTPSSLAIYFSFVKRLMGLRSGGGSCREHKGGREGKRDREKERERKRKGLISLLSGLYIIIVMVVSGW